MKVSIDRLAQHIKELAAIGRNPNGQGVTRGALSPEDMKARHWLIQKMEQAGLSVVTDSAGNIRGRLGAEMDAPAVVTGSHIDTVNCAGPLDGTLGVLAGLEALQVIAESKAALANPLEIIAFTDEEGRFGGMLGSRAIAGTLTQEDVNTAKDVNGVKLTDALKEQGFDPAKVFDAQETSQNLKAFIELHIEQGPVLEAERLPIGVVNAITGLFKWEVTFKGQANHAGTTPMGLRRDAFQGLAHFAGRVDDILSEHGSDNSKMTVGKVQLYPGSPNVVPGACVFTLEVRDTDASILKRLESAARAELESAAKKKGLELSIETLSEIEAIACHPDIVQLIAQKADEAGLAYKIMPSGAAHDAQNMVNLTKTAMIFVPSINGVSHNPAEETKLEDIEAGANLLLSSLYALAGKAAA